MSRKEETRKEATIDDSGKIWYALGYRTPDLIVAIGDYLTATSDRPRPFMWTATVEEILENVRRGRVTLERIAS